MNSSHAHSRSTQTLALLLSLAVLSSGCVSTKYKRAPKETPAPLAFNLSASKASLALALHTVIVYKGPGSWKKEAYWDEYVVSITNQGAQPLTVDSAEIIDALGTGQPTGSDPWLLEKASRENIRKFEHVGRKVLLGVGLTAGWVLAGGVTVAASFAGASALAAVGAATFVFIPVWAISSGVRTLVARSSIKEEFNHRRIALPITLQAKETKAGSFFFPVSPGPQRLLLHCQIAGAAEEVALDLAPLAGLHLLKETTTPAAEAKP